MILRLASIAGFCALVVAGPAFAQTPAPAPRPDSTADRAAIGNAIRAQLSACWSLPPGFEGRRVKVTLSFLGDGTLNGDPEVAASDPKTAAKLAPLVESTVRAIRGCAPFEGLEDFGAAPAERFSIAVDFVG